MKKPVHLFIIFILNLGILSNPRAFANEEQKPNCKLTIRIFMKDGKKKLDIRTVLATSYDDCKRQAKEWKPEPDEDIKKFTVAHSFRE